MFWILLMEDDSNVNINFEKPCNELEDGNMWGVIHYNFFPWQNTMRKRASNILLSMLSNPRYKSLRLLFFSLLIVSKTWS